MIAILLCFVASVASAQQVALAHPANAGFAFSLTTPVELAPGMRVLARPFLPQSSWFDVCLDPSHYSLRIYSLGLPQEYQAQILVPASRTPCSSTLQAVLPADIPSGPAEAVLSDDEGTRYAPAALRILPIRFGLLHEGLPAIANRVESGVQSRIRLTTPAVPGTTVSLRGAGLGKARPDQVTVQFGDVSIRPLAVHPANGEPGLDDIEFVVPRNLSLTGCYVPLVIRVVDTESNLTSLPAMQAAGPCKHRLGLSKTQLESLDAGGRIPLQWLSIRSERVATVLENGYIEFVSVLSGNVGQAILADSTGPEPLPLRAGCRVSTNPRFRPGSGPSYSVYENPEYIDPGDPLTLSGPNGQITTLKSYPFAPSIPTGAYALRLRPTEYPPGAWQLSSTGSDTVQPFRWSFRIPPLWEPDNLDVLSTLSSGVDPELRWNGTVFNPVEWVTLTIYGNENRYQLECTAPATSGLMRVGIADFLKAFGTSPPKAFSGQIILGVIRDPASPYVFPLNLTDGSSGIGLLGGTFQSILPSEITVQ